MFEDGKIIAMAARVFLPQVEYTSTKSFAPSGYQRVPKDAFFNELSRKRTGGPTAETDLREGALEKRKKSVKETNLRDKKVTWGKVIVKDPYRDVIAASVSQSVTTGNHGNYSGQTTASGVTRTAVPGTTAGSTISGQEAIASNNVSAMDVSGGEAGGTNAEGTSATGEGNVNTGGAVAESRHIEASGKNLDDGWVQGLVSSNKGYAIDLASLNYETMVGNMKGFKRLSNTKYGQLEPGDAFVKSVMEGGAKRDYRMSMLDTAATVSEDPFGKRKWNATPANNMANQMLRGLVNANHEGALMFNRGLNQQRNAHIRNPERDVLPSEVQEGKFCPKDVIVINAAPMDIEDSQWWLAPNANEGTLGFHDTHDRIASKLANSANNSTVALGGQDKRGNLHGRGTATAGPNALASDEPWVAQPSGSGSWLGARRPTAALSNGVGFGRSRISAGADRTSGGVGSAGDGQGGFNNGSSANNAFGNNGYGGNNSHYSRTAMAGGVAMEAAAT
jgi:hypothetical protein